MENTKIPAFLNDFGNYLIAMKNYSLGYIKNLNSTIMQFLEFINSHSLKNKYQNISDIQLNDIRGLSNSDIYCYMFFLAENKYKLSTRITKIEYLRNFFDYLFRIKNTIFTEPFKKIQRERKTIKKLPNFLSLEESKKVLTFHSDSKEPLDIRNTAMIGLFLNCGLRVSEMSGLNLSDINLKENKFTVFRKRWY